MKPRRKYEPPRGAVLRELFREWELETRDVAEVCDVSPRTVRKWISYPAPGGHAIPWAALAWLAFTRTGQTLARCDYWTTLGIPCPHREPAAD